MTVWLALNDRDGGTLKRGPRWLGLMYPALWSVNAAAFWAGGHLFVARLLAVVAVLWAGWVLGAHLWWLRHRRGWVWED